MSESNSIFFSGLNQVTIGESVVQEDSQLLVDQVANSSDGNAPSKPQPPDWLHVPIDELFDAMIVDLGEDSMFVKKDPDLTLDSPNIPFLFHGEKGNHLKDGDLAVYDAETDQLYFLRDGRRSTVFVLPCMPADIFGRVPFVDYFLRILARTHDLWLTPHEESKGTKKSWLFYRKSDCQAGSAGVINPPYSW